MQKWLCMQRGYTIERVQVSTSVYDIVLLDGDKVVYIPISPGYYARSGSSGGRIRVNGNRLCKNAILMTTYNTTLTAGVSSWTVPYDGIYEVVINGAGGGGEGGLIDVHHGEQDDTYYWYNGSDGRNGEEITIKKEYSAGDHVLVNIGRGGANGEWLYKREYNRMNDKEKLRKLGHDGGDTTFDGIRALGGAGGGRTNAATNERGALGGYKKHNSRYEEKGQPDWIERQAQDGSIYIRLLAGG